MWQPPSHTDNREDVSSMNRCFLPFVILCALVPSPTAAQMIVDTTGRVLTPFVRSGRSTTASIVMLGAGAGADKKYSAQCRSLSSFDNAAQPLNTDTAAPASMRGQDLVFTIGHTGRDPFLFCSVLRLDNDPLTILEFEKINKDIAANVLEVTRLLKEVEKTTEGAAWKSATNVRAALQQSLATSLAKRRGDAKSAADANEKRIKAFQADIGAFQQQETESAVTEIKRLQEEIRKLREADAANAAEIKNEENTNKEKIDAARVAEDAALKAAEGSAPGQLWAAAKAEGVKLNDTFNQKGKRALTVLTYSHLFVGADERPVFYRLLSGRSEVAAAALERAAAYPVFTTSSRIYAVILNRRLSELPEPFRLTFTQTAGTPPDLAPVRPTTAASAQSGMSSEYTGLESAYGDFVMSFGAPFKAHTVLKATISTVMSQTTENKSTTTIKEDKTAVESVRTISVQKAELLKDEEYPQVRPLYHFNFTTGVVISKLRDTTYARRQTAIDDPATKDVNEARYLDQDIVGEHPVKPMFAVSVYFTPIDVQSRKTIIERLRPAVVLGFAFEKPQDNIYLGLSIEPLESLQLIGGVHIGKIAKAREPRDFDDPTSSTVRATDQRFGKAVFVGLSFNVSFIKSIFKLP